MKISKILKILVINCFLSKSFSFRHMRILLTHILIIFLLVGCGKLNRSDEFLIKIKGNDFGSSVIKFFERDGYLEFSKKLQFHRGLVTINGKFYNEHHFELRYKNINSLELINYHQGTVSIIDPSLDKMFQFPYTAPLIPSVLLDKKIQKIITSTDPKKRGSIKILNEVTKNIQALTYEIFPYRESPKIIQVNFSIEGMEIINLYSEKGEKIESLSSTDVHVFRPGSLTYLNMNMLGKSVDVYNKDDALSKNIDFYGAVEVKVSFYNFPKNYEALSDMHQKVISRNDSEIAFVVNNTGVVREDKQLNNTEYLGKDYFIESKHPDIESLANRLLQSEQSDSQKCRVIMRWLQSNIKKVDTNEISALRVLKNKKGECQGFANLAVAMLRAAGLPAKVVYGVYLNTSSEQPFSFHAWIEVKIDNFWIAKDPTLGKEEIEIHFIKFYDSSLKNYRYNFNKLINSLRFGDLEVLRREL